MSTNATLFKNGFPNVVYPSQHVGKNGQSSKSKSSKGDAEKHRLVAENIVCNTHVGRALQKLARALQFSHDCDRPKWDFAVELLDLEQMGVSHDELRWLIGKGFVDHAREVFSKGGTGRAFDSLGGYTFTEHSCFVITESGSSWYNQSESWLNRAPCAATQMIERPQAEESGSTEVEKPFWDSQRHELRIGKRVVKRFKWRALNQEAILSAFQEDGWPARIDDPLPPTPETDPKRRLSDAIKCLNRKQLNPLLRFSGDGTGEGVLWDLIAETPAAHNGARVD